MDQELYTEFLEGSRRPLLHICSGHPADASCALTEWQHFMREVTSCPPIRHLEIMTSYQKSDSVNRCVYTRRKNLSKFYLNL